MDKNFEMDKKFKTGQHFENGPTSSNVRHIRVKRASYFPIFSAHDLQMTRARQCA